MPKLTFWNTLLVFLILTLVVLLLLRHNPDLDPFTHMEKVSLSDPATPPSCPDCGSVMALRYRHKDGEPFWGCKRYPDCHGTREWGGMTYKDFKWRYEDQYADLPEEELFNVYRTMIGVPKNPGAMSLDTRCPKCYAETEWKVKRNRRDEEEEEYLRCSRYPHCRGEIHWPQPEGDLAHPEWEYMMH